MRQFLVDEFSKFKMEFVELMEYVSKSKTLTMNIQTYLSITISVLVGIEANIFMFYVSFDKAYNQDVVQRLLKLIDFRNDYPAFDGTFHIEPSNDNEMILTWKKDDKYCTLNVDLTTSKSTIKYINDDGITSVYHI